jgi:glycosyltransferase involved in cell wall biosynthesis
MNNWKVVTIHNPVDHDIFKPVDRDTACQNLELDPSKLYILFGAATITNMLKGFNYFLESVQDLAGNPDEVRDVEILLFGKTREDVAALLPLKTRNMAIVQTTRTLVELYSAAHLFVIPSLQDNLPNTILESMFCGTPVVGFRTGGIPEMIDHQVNGYLADYKSSSDLAEGIRWVLKARPYSRLSRQTRDVAVERYSQDRSVQMHIDLYNSLMDKANQS